MALKDQLSSLQEGDWVEIEEKPRKILINITELLESGRIIGDVDGDSNQELDIQKERIKSVKKVKDPRVIDLSDNRQIYVFHDGRLRIDLEDLDKNTSKKLFKELGEQLGYDIK